MTYAPTEAVTAAEGGPGLMQRATAILPMVRPAMRFVPKNPVFLIGAAVGIAGFFAWRNREKIARTAGPMLQNAADRAGELKSRAGELKDRLPWTQRQAAEPTADPLH